MLGALRAVWKRLKVKRAGHHKQRQTQRGHSMGRMLIHSGNTGGQQIELSVSLGLGYIDELE